MRWAEHRGRCVPPQPPDSPIPASPPWQCEGTGFCGEFRLKSDDSQFNPRNTPASPHDTRRSQLGPRRSPAHLFHQKHDDDGTGPQVTLRRVWFLSRAGDGMVRVSQRSSGSLAALVAVLGAALRRALPDGDGGGEGKRGGMMQLR